MLMDTDAALIIGDPALHLDPEKLPYQTLDLGAEWVALRLVYCSIIFAVWAGRTEFPTEEVAEALRASYRWGSEHLDEMVEYASAERGFGKALARDYFCRHIVYPLSSLHLEGLWRCSGNFCARWNPASGVGAT